MAQRTLGGPVLLNFPRPQKLAVPKRRKKAATRAKPTRYEHGPEKCLPECYCQVERKLQQLRRASTAEYLHRRPWFPRSDLSPAEFAQMFNWLYAHAEVLTDARYMRKAWFPEEELPRRAFGQMRDWLQNFSDVLTETDTQKGRRE